MVNLYNVMKLSEERPPNWRDSAIKVIYKTETCPTNFPSHVYNPNETLHQSRQTTCTQSTSSGRKPPSGTRSLRVAAIDFKRSFDTVECNSIWKALREQRFEEPYIQMRTNLHDQQRAIVQTDAISKQFHVKRRVKQCDPPTQHTRVQRASPTHYSYNHGVSLFRFVDDIRARRKQLRGQE